MDTGIPIPKTAENKVTRKPSILGTAEILGDVGKYSSFMEHTVDGKILKTTWDL